MKYIFLTLVLALVLHPTFAQKNKKTMEKQIILTNDAPQPIGPYSQAVLMGNTLYVSGQIALNPQTGQMEQTDIKAETQRVLENLKAVLTAAGYGFEHVAKCTIYCTNLGDFAAINEMYGSYFASNPPARETVQVSALPKGAKVEISVVAVK